MELDTSELALQVTRISTADNWHRRIGHIDAKNLDLMNKTGDNGMCFVGGVSDCNTCTIRMCTQRAHPEEDNLTVTDPSGLAYTDFMGPTSPTNSALEGLENASKSADQYTKWTEVFLTQTKRGAKDTTKLYVKSLVAPLEYRTVRLRADRGTGYTSSAFWECCRQTAIQLEIQATNTPRHSSVRECIRRTQARMA